jgi:two-component system cell cycle response regulator DivK
MAGERILIVDDYEDGRLMYCEYLRHIGYDATSAADGNEALRCATTKTCDVIVLDIAMPKLDGLEVLRKLRGNESTKDVPVIILSASVDKRVRDEAASAGADLFLTKPCEPEQLDRAIRQVLISRLLAGAKDARKANPPKP